MGFKSRKTARKDTLKTQVNNASVSEYIASIADPVRRADCKLLLKLMREVSGQRPKMWGTSIVGFGSYHYKYASGREGDWMRIAFSARKQSLTIYCMPGFRKIQPLLKKLGPVKHSVSCLYVKRLDQLDQKKLRELVEYTWNEMARIYPN